MKNIHISNAVHFGFETLTCDVKTSDLFKLFSTPLLYFLLYSMYTEHFFLTIATQFLGNLCKLLSESGWNKVFSSEDISEFWVKGERVSIYSMLNSLKSHSPLI